MKVGNGVVRKSEARRVKMFKLSEEFLKDLDEVLDMEQKRRWKPWPEYAWPERGEE